MFSQRFLVLSIFISSTRPVRIILWCLERDPKKRPSGKPCFMFYEMFTFVDLTKLTTVWFLLYSRGALVQRPPASKNRTRAAISRRSVRITNKLSVRIVPGMLNVHTEWSLKTRISYSHCGRMYRKFFEHCLGETPLMSLSGLSTQT